MHQEELTIRELATIYHISCIYRLRIATKYEARYIINSKNNLVQKGTYTRQPTCCIVQETISLQPPHRIASHHVVMCCCDPTPPSQTGDTQPHNTRHSCVVSLTQALHGGKSRVAATSPCSELLLNREGLVRSPWVAVLLVARWS